MMLSRRIARPTPPSRKRPASSGPRCTICWFISTSVSRSTRLASNRRIPQIPHISVLGMRRRGLQRFFWGTKRFRPRVHSNQLSLTGDNIALRPRQLTALDPTLGRYYFSSLKLHPGTIAENYLLHPIARLANIEKLGIASPILPRPGLRRAGKEHLVRFVLLGITITVFGTRFAQGFHGVEFPRRNACGGQDCRCFYRQGARVLNLQDRRRLFAAVSWRPFLLAQSRAPMRTLSRYDSDARAPLSSEYPRIFLLLLQARCQVPTNGNPVLPRTFDQVTYQPETAFAVKHPAAMDCRIVAVVASGEQNKILSLDPALNRRVRQTLPGERAVRD